MMNPLLEYFRNNPGRMIHKWVHYFDIYHRYFARFRGEAVTLVEVGVFQGGSLQMWKHYLGPKARIVGVDIDPRCASLVEEQIEVHLGDQSDRGFLRSLRERIGEFNILIDDGGHQMHHQIVTFEEMFPALSVGGVYLVEDLHTSYWPEYGGGRRRRTWMGGERRPTTFIEYSKDLIDELNAWHFRETTGRALSHFTQSALAMHYHDSVLVIEKGEIVPPRGEVTGTPSFELPSSLEGRGD